jgi:hypothetical protein
MVAAALAMVVLFARADSNSDRGAAAAQGVLGQWGTDDKFSHQAMQPMSTQQPMTTVDGSKSFNAQTSCSGSQKFMTLTMVPDSQGDLQSLAVDLDTNMDGTLDQHTLLNGPYAAVCVNGLIQCPAGTINNCRYYQWLANSSGVSLNSKRPDGSPLTQTDLGGCYCINNACGSGLMTRNSGKILTDLGTGIAVSMQSNQPRFSISSAQQVDPMTANFFGAAGGCGSDKQPEQYYSNSTGMTAAGQTAASDPNSDYNKVLNSQLAQQHGYNVASCRIDRSESVQSSLPSDAVTSSLPSQSCGANCSSYLVGDTTLRRWDDGNGCVIHPFDGQIQVNYANVVQSATLVDTEYDAWMQVLVNNNLVWNDPAAWNTPDFPYSDCDSKRTHTSTHPGTDITSFFKAAGTVDVSARVMNSGFGDGWLWVNVQLQPICQVGGESISDTCQAEENNQDCYLDSETVDGVQTEAAGAPTGLQPLPSTQSISGPNSCSVSVERPWWHKLRTYHCKSGTPPYDGSDAMRRYNSIHSTFDPKTGSYTDTTVQNGTTTTFQSSIPLVPPDKTGTCVQMCKTRKLRPGIAVGQDGAVNQLNNTGPAYDYNYKECGDDGTCPADAGEDVVQACNCRSNFAEATSVMQGIRQAAEDTVCTKSP